MRGFLGVSEGTRTPDRRDHNPELYQLSYAHQGKPQCSGENARRARRSEHPTVPAKRRIATRIGYAIFIPEIARLITSRWISDVPSKIV